MEGLGSSGRLVGSIPTYPGTYQCPWSGVMAKNPGGEISGIIPGCLHEAGRKLMNTFQVDGLTRALTRQLYIRGFLDVSLGFIVFPNFLLFFHVFCY